MLQFNSELFKMRLRRRFSGRDRLAVIWTRLWNNSISGKVSQQDKTIWLEGKTNIFALISYQIFSLKIWVNFPYGPFVLILQWNISCMWHKTWSECKHPDATKWMQPSECNQVNATKPMQPSECYTMKATNWMKPSK